MALTSMMNSAFAFGSTADVAAASDPTVGLVMGASGLPIPGPEYVSAANGLYIDNPLRPNFPGTEYPPPYANGLFTPEGLYPLTGVKTLPVNYPVGAQGYAAGQQTSVSQGVTILENAIASNEAAGNTSTVFGYSQSATIAGEAMRQLDPTGTPEPTAPLHFVLIGDPSNPNGGILERFGPSEVPGLLRPELNLPSLGFSFDGATPADDFTTVMYTREYDGFADFPRYPINFLSDLNAFLGIEEIHGGYLTQLTPQQIAPISPSNPGGAIELPTTGGLTTYFMIPTQDLPLLDPLRGIPVVGNPLADLLQPDLRLIVNLGYDNPNPLEGWDAGPANEPTPFGLFPPLSQVIAALQQVVPQTELGIQNFIGDFTGGGPNPLSLDSPTSIGSLTSLLSGSSGTASILSDPLAALSTLASDPTALLSSPTDIANNISGAASTAYATLLPTADIANALLTSIPAYDVSLFMDNLSSPLNAIGLPLAADTALFTLAGGFEFDVLSSAVSTIAADLGLGALTALIP
ncbi:MAG: PE-PPE domain-containing protein [Mycobacterium sp.]|nr:PE-PPE domain-containing protein [Mycobacterium sp.]